MPEKNTEKDNKSILQTLAQKYETPSFLEKDPARFMHEVEGDANKEAAAFIASALSLGSRDQFMPRIAYMIFDIAKGNLDSWIRTGAFAHTFSQDSKKCFYRFFTHADIHQFLATYCRLMAEEGTLGAFVKRTSGGDGATAVTAICEYFGGAASGGVIPKDAKSACKRICMFLRWMVRTNSPVDIGLWADFIDKRTLIVPLDTHVLQQANKLGIISTKVATFSAAKRITAVLADAFPDDPLKGDFALFGAGVNKGK